MILDKLVLYFEYPFVRYALAAGVLIALCSSLIGVTLVLKRFSFIGDGLSHVAFGALAVATIFDMSSSMPLVMCITVASAILLLRTGRCSCNAFRRIAGCRIYADEYILVICEHIRRCVQHIVRIDIDTDSVCRRCMALCSNVHDRDSVFCPVL